jgi:hypothetical protein
LAKSSLVRILMTPSHLVSVKVMVKPDSSFLATGRRKSL